MPSSTDSYEVAARALVEELPPGSVPAPSFLGARFDRGLAFVDDPDHQAELEQLLREADAPDPFVRNPIALGMVAPTIRAHGTADQQDRLLRNLFTGEEVWCQLFSEPGAGSDLACRAERTDDGGSSPGRRCGRRWPMWRVAACCWPAPTPKRQSTRV
jgi:hypothetical protein